MADLQWNSICRVCLTEGEMISIHEKDEADISIKDKIIACSRVEFVPNSTFPEQICSGCLGDLVVAYRFYSNCENTEAVLKSITENLMEDPGSMSDTQEEESDDRILVKTEPDEYELSGNEDPDIDGHVEFLDNASDADLDFKNQVDENDLIEKYDNDDVQEESNSSAIEEVISKEELEKQEAENEQQILEELIKNNDNVSVLNVRPVITNKRRKKEEEVTIEMDENGQTKIISTVRNKPLKVCEICGNTYKYRHALESHMRRHRGEKPFQCPHCEKAFVIAFELKRHMRTHTGQKPYACKFCDRKFSDFGSRIKHERCHTGERPYICSQCGKTFAYSHVLSSHMLTHTGERRFHCEECGKRFAKSHHLKAHKNTHSRAPRERSISLMTKPTATLKPMKFVQQHSEETSVMDNSSSSVVVRTTHHDGTHLEDFAISQNIFDYSLITVIDAQPGPKQEPKSDDDQEEIGEIIFQTDTASMTMHH